MYKIRTGVIGVGSMGQNHARVYSEISKLVGVSDVNALTSETIAKKFNVKSFENYEELIKEVDAVTISVPTIFHKEVALKVAGAGVHFLIEKPIASNLAEAEEIITIGNGKKLKMAVGHIERHNPVISYAKKAIANKEWGDLLTISSKRLSNYPDRIRDVGVILDLATHELDIMRYLAGSEVNVIKSTYGQIEHKKYEDHAAIIIKFENGIQGICEVNWITPQKIRSISLTCTKAFVELDYINQTVKINESFNKEIDSSNLYKNDQVIKSNFIKLPKEEPLKVELLDFLSTIGTKSNPKVTAEDGFKSLEMALNSLKQ